MKKRLSFFAALLSAVLALSSCEFKWENLNPFSKAKVTEVNLNVNSLELTQGQPSGDITVQVKGKKDYNKNVKIVSEAPKVASPTLNEVSSGQTFKVRPGDAGSTKINVISVGDESVFATLSVKVKSKEETDPIKVTSVTTDVTTKLFKEGDSGIDVVVTVNGTGLYDKKANISSANPAVVTVDKTQVTSGSSFKMTPVAEGNTTVKVTSNGDSTKFTTITVKVEKNEVPPVTDSVSLGLTSKEIKENESFVLDATASGEISWTLEGENANEILEIVKSDNNGATIKGLKVGGATVKATVGTASATCDVTVSEAPKDIRDLYVTNNSTLGYEDMYFYAWNAYDEHNEEWPGVKLSEKCLNDHFEECYTFQTDIIKYPNFLFNNGLVDQEGFKKTCDCDFEGLDENNNIYFMNDGADGSMLCHFATFAPAAPKVEFAVESVSILPEQSKTVAVSTHMGDASYEVKGEEDVILLGETSNESVSFTALKTGVATIEATIPDTDAKASLTVNVLDPSVFKEFYFSNNKGWENVYLYTWGENGSNADWPGEKLENPVKNNHGEDVYKFSVNTANYTSFVMNNGDGEQSKDITFLEFGTKDNVYLTEKDAEGKYGYDFATYSAKEDEVSFDIGEAEGLSLYVDETKNVAVSANGEGVMYEVTVGEDVVELSEMSDAGLKVKGLKAGVATIEATLGTAKATLAVSVSEFESDVREIYFTNNFGWDELWIHAWGDFGHLAEYPGTKIETNLKNNASEPVGKFEIDIAKYPNFLLSDGTKNDAKKTADATFAGLVDGKDNIWFDGLETAHYATFTPFEDKIEFVLGEEQTELALYVDETKAVSVTSTLEGVEYAVTTGEDVVELSDTSDTGLKVTGLKEGTAVITASKGDVSATLNVVVSEFESDVREIYFTNNFGWDELWIHAWGDLGHLAKYPGTKLETSYKNKEGEPVAKFSIDIAKYPNFLLSDGTEDDAKKTVDASFAGLEEYDNVWFDGLDTVRFATFKPYEDKIEFVLGEEETSLAIYVDQTKSISVNSTLEGVAYEVTSGSEYVEITAQSDEGITISGKATGSAVITATLGTSTATLNVTVNEAHTHVYDPETHICTHEGCDELDPEYAIVTFEVKYVTSPGQDIYIMGDFCDWSDTAKAVKMHWTDGHIWKASVTLKIGDEIGFKFAMKDGSGLHYEKDGTGNERRYTVTETKTETLSWGNY